MAWVQDVMWNQQLENVLEVNKEIISPALSSIKKKVSRSPVWHAHNEIINVEFGKRDERRFWISAVDDEVGSPIGVLLFIYYHCEKIHGCTKGLVPYLCLGNYYGLN